MKKGDIKIGTNGVKDQLVKRLGKGGQAEVWKAQNIKTKDFFAYKEYKHNTNNVKANIEDLIKIGKFHDKDGNPVDDVVLPITVVECNGDSFGYIMELVDLQDFTVVKKAWCGKYPSCKAICKIVQNFARVFETLHTTYGMCYKDVNEGNIFFNPQNGDIRIIDNDNIGYADKFTIKGTNGYMAPEVVLGDKPDTRSDMFSFAVFVYRLLVGGFPFEGPYTEQYCVKNNVLPDDARKVIFGKNALFVWHPTNKQNSIENSTDPQIKGQVEYWKKLPDSVKDMFISTFATNLSKDRRAERTSDVAWKEKFAEIEGNLVKCPHCGKITFSESGQCFECSGLLKSKKHTNNTPRKQTSTSTHPVTSGNITNVVGKGTTSTGASHKHKVMMKILSAGEAKREVEVYVADIVTADKLSKNLASGNVFKVLYNKKEKKLGIKNLTSISWVIVHADQTKEKCEPGQVQVLEKGMMVRIIPKTAQLNIIDLQ